MDCFIQEWDASIRDNRVLTLYKTVTDTFEYELYLDVIKDKYLCHALTKLRVSSHKLRIETGRYGRNRIERHERLCELCIPVKWKTSTTSCLNVRVIVNYDFNIYLFSLPRDQILKTYSDRT